MKRLGPSHRTESGRSLAALLVTLVALASVWAVVWLNVPRVMTQPPPRPSPPAASEDISTLIPPSLLKSSSGTAPSPPPAVSEGHAIDQGTSEPAGDRAQLDPPLARAEPGLTPALNCREEARKLCGEAEPGSGRFRDCMRQHRELMPVACQHNGEDTVAGRRLGARAILTACQADLRRWCPSSPLKGAPIIRCLREHASSLSAECNEILVEERVL